MLLGIYCPGISNWLELTAVDGPGWVMVVICCSIMLSLVEFEKMLIRRLHGTV
jgi:Ca2+-transporting ATPase